ncbi:MAG: hypothetical protein DHS80DRAFT_32678 [Piptocephalis tieghemiana]|nr:MAG: hypothetical protein DHS80DRAFT_32678 [Piptocephalis tieghemiana]
MSSYQQISPHPSSQPPPSQYYVTPGPSFSSQAYWMLPGSDASGLSPIASIPNHPTSLHPPVLQHSRHSLPPLGSLTICITSVFPQHGQVIMSQLPPPGTGPYPHPGVELMHSRMKTAQFHPPHGENPNAMITIPSPNMITIPQPQPQPHHPAQMTPALFHSSSACSDQVTLDGALDHPEPSPHPKADPHSTGKNPTCPTKDLTQGSSFPSPISPERRVEGNMPLPPQGGSGHPCSHCGKEYKHPTCLTKHMWEHSPLWPVVSRVIPTASKHQQVQMLEAAQILLDMSSVPTPPSSLAFPTKQQEGTVRA